MKSKLLIEKQDKKLWRLVSRSCTARGLSKDAFIPIEVNLPNYFSARMSYELTRYILK